MQDLTQFNAAMPRSFPAVPAPNTRLMNFDRCLRVTWSEVDAMRPATREEDRLTEDEIARRKLGPRGVPGEADSAKMTPQQESEIPKSGAFDGHTA
jgi:hypothetical protein